MIEKLVKYLGGIIVAFISATGYYGIIAAMCIESACIPLPSEIIMPFSGYLVATGRFTSVCGPWMALVYVSAAGAFGCVIGSIIAYVAGVWGGRPFLEKYVKYILISRHDMDNADRWFAKYGQLSAFISRMLPVIRTFISLPAGIGRVPFIKFIFYTFIGSFPWCFLLSYIGYEFGKRAGTFLEWEMLLKDKLGRWMHLVDAVIIIIILAGVVWFVKRHLSHRKLEKVIQK
ncbi:MAG: DedA family protein [Elusimicrobiota bacterium]